MLRFFSFDNGTIHPCQYEDTDSYVITKTFVNNRQHFFEPASERRNVMPGKDIPYE